MQEVSGGYRVVEYPPITELVKGNSVVFHHYWKGTFYYNLVCNPSNITGIGGSRLHVTTYTFGIPIEDVGDGMLLKADKAITYMRLIRRAMDLKALVKNKD